MVSPDAITSAEPKDESLVQIVNTLLRFVVVVRYRKHIVLAALSAAVLMGGLYYATAARHYASKAQLLVMYTSSDTASAMVAGNTMVQNYTPTFETLITTTKVLEEAVPHLRPEDCLDLAGAARERWPAIIQGNLSAHAINRTNVIIVEYRSRDPNGGVAVLNAVVQAYVEFLDKTNKGTAGEIIRVLTKEKADVAEKLVRKEEEMLDARRQLGDLAIRTDGNTLPPTVQKVMSFNQSLVDAQKKRIELEASLAAAEAAVRHGDDLMQYMTTAADSLSRDIFFRALGLDSQDAAVMENLSRGLMEDRAALRAMQQHLGPAHPEVVAKSEKIRMSEQYMAQHQQRLKRQMAELRESQFPPMLLQMLRQRVSEARQVEAGLKVQYEQARNEAISLNGQLARLEVLDHDVKWLRELQDALLNRISNISVKHEGPDIRTEVVEEAKGGGSPISPKLAAVVMASLAGGLALGLILVILLDVLDDRFRSLDELQAQLGMPVLTIVRQLPAAATAGSEAVHVHVSPDSTESEAFRTLRTALALAEGETRRLVVSSSEPGDGKTTVIANLAACYAQADKKTLLIDADLRRPGLTALLGMRGVDGLSRILRGEDDIGKMAAACLRKPGIPNLDVIPSGARLANPTELLAGPRFPELLAWAETVYDQILIDCPPTLVTSDVAVIGRLTDGVALVVQPGKNRRRQVLRSVETLLAMKVPLLGIIVNRTGADDDSGYYGYSSGYGYGYGYSYYGYHEENGENSQRPDGEEETDGEVADGQPRPPVVALGFPRPNVSNAARGGPGIIPRRAA
jgi:polysaccharide biosynthesis transport protein